MFRARRSLAGMVALGLLGVVAAGVAASGRQPDTDSVMATVVFSHVEGKTRSCEGVDGEYAEQYVTVTGTSTGDPRLSGKVTFSVYVIVNVENGVGTENGTIRIQEAQTGRTKVKAQAKDAGRRRDLAGPPVRPSERPRLRRRGVDRHRPDPRELPDHVLAERCGDAADRRRGRRRPHPGRDLQRSVQGEVRALRERHPTARDSDRAHARRGAEGRLAQVASRCWEPGRGRAPSITPA